VNEWTAQKMWEYDIEDYRERAIVSEAGHMLMAYLCGVPISEYSRVHVGYPIRSRPTGRALIFSSRRGDPEVTPRGRPFGLPPWASLERDLPDDDFTAAAIDPEPVRNGYTAREIDSLSLVLLAGPVAEYLLKGSSTNGAQVTAVSHFFLIFRQL